MNKFNRVILAFLFLVVLRDPVLRQIFSIQPQIIDQVTAENGEYAGIAFNFTYKVDSKQINFPGNQKNLFVPHHLPFEMELPASETVDGALNHGINFLIIKTGNNMFYRKVIYHN